MHLPHSNFEADKLHQAMGGLSLDERSSERQPAPGTVFPFFSLPLEIRLRIYEHLLLIPDRVVDLDPLNSRIYVPRMRSFLVCKQMHEEAARIFYGYQTFRLFPLHGRFFQKKPPLLSRLPATYREDITSIELRLGPGWHDPPKTQKVDDALGLDDCHSLRTLKVFVEIDPSQDIFTGFRGKDNAKDTYKFFCLGLVRAIFERAPSILSVELDAYPSIKKDSPIIVALISEIRKASKKLIWGPMRGWDSEADCGQIGLENALASLSLTF